MLKKLSSNLFLKIGVIVFGSVVLLLGSLFYYLAFMVVQADNKAKSITASLTSQAVLDKIDRNFYERFGDVQAFAYNVLAKQSLDSGVASPELQSFINTMTSYYVLYDVMMVCDVHGKVLAANTIDKKGAPIAIEGLLAKNFATEDWFKQCTTLPGPAGGAWYSDFTKNNDVATIYKSNGYGLAFAAPIKNDAGDITGVWYNFANWQDVTQDIRAASEAELQQSNEEAYIILTNQQGQIIDAADPALIRENIRLNEAFTQDSQAGLPIAGKQLAFDAYISSWSTAHGAYTYKGNRWKAITIVSSAAITPLTFLSQNLLPIELTALGIVMLLGLYLHSFVRKSVVQKLYTLREAVSGMSKGRLEAIPDSLLSQDEMGQMGHAMAQLTQSLQAKALFSDEIAKGNLSASLAISSADDVLGNSLLNMRDQLNTVAEEDKKRNWVTVGLAKFGEMLRGHMQLEAMGNVILHQLVKYLDANQGALFVAQTQSDGTTSLEMIACYAFDRKKYIHKQIKPGQGLVGQAYLEKDLIYLTEIPNDYITITSGLGEATPRSIVLIPLQTSDRVEGILELASFRTYQPFELDFLAKLAETIGSTLATVKINERTQLLLEESRQQAEKLQAQEEEMRQNIEEMQATQEETQRKEREYQRHIEQLEQRLIQTTVH